MDFVGDIVAVGNSVSACKEHFIKLTTSARDTDNHTLPANIVTGLSDLALNGNKQSRFNLSNAYPDIKSMVVDYVYDYINGHTANQWGSGVSEQKPMKF